MRCWPRACAPTVPRRSAARRCRRAAPPAPSTPRTPPPGARSRAMHPARAARARNTSTATASTTDDAPCVRPLSPFFIARGRRLLRLDGMAGERARTAASRTQAVGWRKPMEIHMRKLPGLAFAALVAGVLAAPALAEDGVTATEIVLGNHTALSGPVSAWGIGSTEGMRMRFDEANEKGIHGRKVKFVVEDHQYQVPRAVQAANK